MKKLTESWKPHLLATVAARGPSVVWCPKAPKTKVERRKGRLDPPAKHAQWKTPVASRKVSNVFQSSKCFTYFLGDMENHENLSKNVFPATFAWEDPGPRLVGSRSLSNPTAATKASQSTDEAPVKLSLERTLWSSTGEFCGWRVCEIAMKVAKQIKLKTLHSEIYAYILCTILYCILYTCARIWFERHDFMLRREG